MSAGKTDDPVPAWVQREIEFPDAIQRGDKNTAVKRVQEWLTLHDCQLAIDKDFGPATQRAVEKFQSKKSLPVTGRVNRATHTALIQPLLNALRPISLEGKPLKHYILRHARQHLASHPREVGGSNRGPWVRLYMSGKEGVNFPWCAGFVTFVLKQACRSLEKPPPIKGSVGCDALAQQGKGKGLFVLGSQVRAGGIDLIGTGSIFLNRKTSTDWTHTGFVSRVDAESFDTIEGNTNDAGDREGYEVCARTRSYKKRDFIVL